MKRKLIFVIMLFSHNIFAQSECEKDAVSDKCRIEKLEKALVLLHDKFDRLTSHVLSDSKTDYLNVKGHVQIKAGGSDPTTNSIYSYNPDGGQAILAARVRDRNAGDPFISLDVANETGWSLGLDNDDGNKFKFSNHWSDINNNTKMTITMDGKVGIGTTAPDEKLHVAGTINSSGLKVGGKTVVTKHNIKLHPTHGSNYKEAGWRADNGYWMYSLNDMPIQVDGKFLAKGGFFVGNSNSPKEVINSSGKFIGISLNWGKVYTTDWLNSWDAVVNYSLPEGYVMVGLYSEHDNGSEDRKWKVKYRKLSLNGV